jgi:hypothetical protein
LYGLLISQEYIDEVREALQGSQIIFEKTGDFKSDTFLQHCQSVSNIQVQTLIVDMSCTDDNSLMKGIRVFRFSRNARIILLAPGRKPGDHTINMLVGLQVWDIIAPDIPNADEHNDQEDDEYYGESLSILIKQQLAKETSYSDAARWHFDVPAESHAKSSIKEKNPQNDKHLYGMDIGEIDIDALLPLINDAPSYRNQNHVTMVSPTIHAAKCIVIGSLYPSAGSSFVAMCLTRLLNYLSIENALVESPVGEPELYHLLFGNECAPEATPDPDQKDVILSYRFIADQIINNGTVPKNALKWIDGKTTWYPTNPDGIHEEWTYNHTLRLLQIVKSPIVIYDVSHHWEHDSVSKVCHDADEIIFVSDTSPSKSYRSDTVRNTGFLRDLKDAGKSVHIIGNRDIDSRSSGKKEWLSSMPIEPTCLIPDIPHIQVIEALWEGMLVQDDTEVLQNLYQSCHELLRSLIPSEIPIHVPTHKRNGLFSRIFKG